MANVTHVKKARKARPQDKIKVGDEYWVWSHQSGGRFVKTYFKTRPTRQQTESSPYKKSIYDLEDKLNAIVGELRTNSVEHSYDDVEGDVDDLISDIEALGEEQREFKEAMPDNFKDNSPNSDLFDERADGCDATVEAFREALREIEGLAEESGNQNWPNDAADILEGVSWEM